MAEWMYDDGPGGTNADCPAAGGGGCWGHRDIILGQYAAPALMGVGYGRGTTQLFVGGDTVDTPYFTWAQEIPFLPVGVFPYGVNDSVLPGTVADVVHPAVGLRRRTWTSRRPMSGGEGRLLSSAPHELQPARRRTLQHRPDLHARRPSASSPPPWS